MVDLATVDPTFDIMALRMWSAIPKPAKRVDLHVTFRANGKDIEEGSCLVFPPPKL
jgi:hypothetical protein